MKKLKFSLLFALLVAFLAACGSDDDGGATLGSLLVTVNGPESATVSVTGPSASSQTVAGSTTFADLTPGSYTVSGSADGFETTNETVVVVAGEQAAVGLSLPKIAQPAVNSVTLSPPSLELEVGEVGSLQATVSGNEDLSRDDMGVTYTSSNTDVATVSREGVVTAFAAGTAVITATSDFDPSYFDNTRVTASLGSSNQNQTDGVLGIRVEGNEGRAFDFTVTGPGGFSQTVSTSGRTTLTVPAGSYTVAAQEEVSVDASLSYVATSSQQTVTVSAGQLEEVAFAYQRVNPGAETNIATFEFISAVDAQGEEYMTRMERNVSKEVRLSASQTEEVFCVTFEALDADGNPVPNAGVGIDVTGTFVGNFNVNFDWDDVITVVPVPSGDCANLSLNTSRAIDTQQVAVDSTLSTDAQGRVTFGLFATDGIRPNPLANNSFNGFVEEPAKIVLTASNADTTIVDELKVWFINITHLTYFDRGDFATRFVNNPFRVADSAGEFARNHVSTEGLAGGAQLSTVTLEDGTEVGAFANAFDGENPAANVHRFDTYFYQKQPEEPDRSINQAGVDPGKELGYMRYEIITGQDDYSFDRDSCDNLRNDDLCLDVDGVAELVLREDATREDFPLVGCVRATYVARASFRDDTFDGDDSFYDFDLKSYTFCKTFSSLSVVKFADNHVLSWAGPRKDNNTGRILDPVRAVTAGNVTIEEGFRDTLRAFNHTPSINDPFTSTYRIFVSNPSSGSINNLVISDDLPAELGVDIESIRPRGEFPTYDADNHVLTWDFRDPALAPLLDNLGPGEYLEFAYDVYARQKPGVQWTAPVRDTPNQIFNAPGFENGWIDYVRAPMYPNYDVRRDGASVIIDGPIAPTPETAYPDPYCITNGDDFANVNNRLGNDNDVTVEFGVSGTRQVIDYDPIADESDICVVRPLFNLTKRRVTNFEVNRGETVSYELIARQVDRVGINAPALPLTNGPVPNDPANPRVLESAANEREYAWLADLYPWEFGVDADGLGHRADEEWYKRDLPALLGVDPTDPDEVPVLPEELVDEAGNRIQLTADVVAPPSNAPPAPRRSDDTFKRRDNPIGSNVVVFDTFDVGLDYVSDNDLMIINLDNDRRFHTILDPDYASVIASAANLQATIAEGRKPGNRGTGSGIRAISGEEPGIADKRFQYETLDQFLPDDVGVSTIVLRAGLASSANDPERTPVNGSTAGNRRSFYLDDWDGDPNTGINVDDFYGPLPERFEFNPNTPEGQSFQPIAEFEWDVPGSEPQEVDPDATVNVDGVWYNCAYLDAFNMNQPSPIYQNSAFRARNFAPTSYGASWYNGQEGVNDPEVSYIDSGFFWGRPFDLRGNEDPYPFLRDYSRDLIAGINDYPWDRNDISNAIGEFLSADEVAELAARGNPLEYQPPYNPARLPVSYNNPPDNIGIGEWNTNDDPVASYLVGSVAGALAITRPVEGTGIENLNINLPHANQNNPLAGRNKDEVTNPFAPNEPYVGQGYNPHLLMVDSVTGAIRNTRGFQRGIEGCAGVRAIQEVPIIEGSIEFTPRGETFQGGRDGANLVAVQAFVPIGRQYYYQIDFLNAGDTTVEDIVFTALFENDDISTDGGLFSDARRFIGLGNARYVANDEGNDTDDTGDNFPSQIFEGRISPQFPLDVPQVRPFRLLGAADIVDARGALEGPAGQGVAPGNTSNTVFTFANPIIPPDQIPAPGQPVPPDVLPADVDGFVDADGDSVPFLNRVIFNNDGLGYTLRPGRVLRLMVKAQGIDIDPVNGDPDGVADSEQAIFVAFFTIDGEPRDFRVIRDETDIGNNPNN